MRYSNNTIVIDSFFYFQLCHTYSSNEYDSYIPVSWTAVKCTGVYPSVYSKYSHDHFMYTFHNGLGIWSLLMFVCQIHEHVSDVYIIVHDTFYGYMFN